MHADIIIHSLLKEHIRLIVCDSLIVKFTVAFVLGDHTAVETDNILVLFLVEPKVFERSLNGGVAAAGAGDEPFSGFYKFLHRIQIAFTDRTVVVQEGLVEVDSYQLIHVYSFLYLSI